MNEESKNEPVPPVSPATSPNPPKKPISESDPDSITEPTSESSSTKPTSDAPSGSEPTETEVNSDPEPAPETAVEPTDSSNTEVIVATESTTDSASGSAPESSSESSTTSQIDSTPQPVVPDSVVGPEKKSKKGLLIGCLIVLFLLAGGFGAYWYLYLRPVPESPQANQVSPTSVGDAANALRLNDNSLSDFDLAFLRLENNDEKANQNKIYSPLSIKYALAMLKDGANGESRTQIENLIGDYVPKAYLNSENRSLANAMFINNTFKEQVLSSYTDSLSSKYNAEVVYDSFTSPDPLNTWVSDKTLGIITNMFKEDIVNPGLNYMLINALAIDMEWERKLQPETKGYDVLFYHETSGDGAINNKVKGIFDDDSFEKISFDGGEKTVKAAQIAATANRYDIISEIGEEKIRETVSAEYQKWLNDLPNEEYYDTTFDIEQYISELKMNYGHVSNSSDFAFSDSETERVFVKDLKEYDGTTLEYVGIMPKAESLGDYMKNLTAEQTQTLIDGAKDSASLETYKEGVVTKLTGYIPFFKFNYELDLLADLKSLGIEDVFDPARANLSGMLKIDEDTLAGENRPYINVVKHKADIDFSNNGIKAAAVTAAGGLGGGANPKFEYLWDVPVETIDITFDKPFLFLIRDKSSGEIWFTGSVANLE